MNTIKTLLILDFWVQSLLLAIITSGLLYSALGILKMEGIWVFYLYAGLGAWQLLFSIFLKLALDYSARDQYLQWIGIFFVFLVSQFSLFSIFSQFHNNQFFGGLAITFIITFLLSISLIPPFFALIRFGRCFFEFENAIQPTDTQNS